MHTSSRAADEDLIGAELVSGATSIGHILDVRRDPISQRVWRLITTYGPHGRRVAVPMEWVVRRTPTRVTLAVGTRELDDLPDQRELGPLFSRAGVPPLFVRPGVPHVNGAAV
jgi:hypothetical protein